MLQSESLPIMAWFDVYISKYFCYFNRQGGSSHGWETFHIRHLEMEPWSGSHEVQYLRKMEPRWMQSKEFSPVMSSQDSKSEREELAAVTHTKPPETFPGLETMWRKLDFPAKFTTPCQGRAASHVASRITPTSQCVCEGEDGTGNSLVFAD